MYKAQCLTSKSAKDVSSLFVSFIYLFIFKIKSCQHSFCVICVILQSVVYIYTQYSAHYVPTTYWDGQ